jgi:crossover junction endodeoxyribonuclease RuvC
VNVVAFDLSLTSTGWADSTGGGLLVPANGCVGVPRLRWIRDRVLARSHGADVVVIEGYAFGRIEQAHHLGELGGVVRLALSDAGNVVAEVPPSSLKMFATGKGNAPKDLVLAEAIRKLGYSGHSKDEADAIWLREMALAHYIGLEDRGVTVPQRKALGKIAWPVITSRATEAPAA